MAISGRKINAFTSPVSNLPDQPSLTATQLKQIFDASPEQLREALNGLIDDLMAASGASEIGSAQIAGLEGLTVRAQLVALMALKVSGTSIKGIRVNTDGYLEYTSDGTNWQATASSGHIIVNSSGAVMTQRSRLKFINSTVTDNGTETIVNGVQGPAGPKGDTGAKGDTGSQGVRGQAVVPSVATNGDLSWEVKDAASAPATRNIKGPQGPQGIQGVQGPQGIQGAQGPQGPQGVQGDDGPKGDDGRDFKVLGLYATLTALQTAHATGTAGDAYAVGTVLSNVVYIWDAGASAWVNIGALQGPQGPQGSQGIQGPEGPQGAQGPQGVQGPQGEQGIQGPQGDTGATGATGPKGDTGATGPKGDTGDTGPTGPNQVNTTTTTNITGLLKGNGTNVQQAQSGTDYAVPVSQLTALPTSGTALTNNAEYRVSLAVGTYTFAWPSNPFEVWLLFSTSSTFNISFPAGTKYVGGAPTFKASTQYEMSVKDGVVIVREVTA